MSTFTITLNNGTQLSNIKMNGGMYVSPDKITRRELDNDALKKVIITESVNESTVTTTLHDAVCDAIMQWPEGWLFNLREPSADEIERKQLMQRIDDAESALIELAEMIGG